MGKFFPILVLVLGSAYFFATKDNYDAKSVAGKRVLVTGSSSGIGEELAYHYSELGARLVLTARRVDLLERVAQRCRELGAREVSVVPADMAKPEDRLKVVEHTRKQLQGLDHLILNHAVLRSALWQSTPENLTTLQNDVNVNFFSFVDLTSRFMPWLVESEGRIGAVSSVLGKIGFPRSTTYCTSKFAMQGFYSALRQELIHRGDGVSVTIAVLGAIYTEAARAVTEISTPDVDFKSIAASPRDAAQAIVRAVETRAYELYYGWMASVLVNLHKIFPDTFEYYVAGKTLQ